MFTRFIYPFKLREKVSCYLQRFFKKLPDQGVTLAFDRRLKLNLNAADLGHRSIILNGFYELALSRRIVAHARNGGLMIDVGANYGYYSCLWAGMNTSNTVMAFEPSGANIQPLLRNLVLNGIHDRVQLFAYALGKERGTSSFSPGDEVQTGWGGLTLDEHPGLDRVRTETLDYFAAEQDISLIDVLKIDTEGADAWVLYGAEKLLREKRILYVFFEINKPRMKLLGIREQDPARFLEKMGYSVKKITATEYMASAV